MAVQSSSTSPMMKHSIWLATRQIVGPTFWASVGLLSLLSMGYPALAQAITDGEDAASLTPLEGSAVRSVLNVQRPGIQYYASSTLLFVNPYLGDDGVGDGSQRSPLRTLTRALTVAESGTVVVLAPGIYDESNGEQFPIQLKSGVTVQGDPGNLGNGILIQGGGRFLSPTFAGQDVTLLGADEAVLIGVTVTNPNSRGYGLWVESTSPIVTRNTFIHNIHDGVSITGDGRPTIQGNHFYRNGANGVTIYGTSQPNIQGNVFEETGFGINMGQKAAPRLVDNRIWNNRSGIVIQGEAQPLLRRNVVEFNEQDGLVAIAQSRPNLGLDDDPGQNRFSDNGQSDINAEVAVHPVISIGNTLDLNRVTGQVRTTMPPVRVASQPTRSSSTSSPLPRTTALPPDSLPTDSLPTGSSTIAAQRANERADEQPLVGTSIIGDAEPAGVGDRSILRILSSVPENSISPIAETLSSPPQGGTSPSARLQPLEIPTSVSTESAPIEEVATELAQAQVPDLEEGAIEIPILFPGESDPDTNDSLDLLTLQTSALTPSVSPARIEDTGPSSAREVVPSSQRLNAPSTTRSLPSITIRPTLDASRSVSPGPIIPPENLLPVPGTSVPEGHLGNLSTLPAQQTELNTALLATIPFRPTSTRASAIRYRVLAEANTYEARSLINTIAPDAFFTQVNGRSMMQIGAYSQLDNANDIAYQLVEYGLQVEVQRID